MKHFKALALSLGILLIGMFSYAGNASAHPVSTEKMEIAVNHVAYFNTIVDMEPSVTAGLVYWTGYLDVPFGTDKFAAVTVYFYDTQSPGLHHQLVQLQFTAGTTNASAYGNPNLPSTTDQITFVDHWTVIFL